MSVLHNFFFQTLSPLFPGFPGLLFLFYRETLRGKGLTKEQLGLARNEIFARHGRMFDTAEIQQYFDSRSWYVPKYAPAEFDAMGDGIFNEYEKYNMESIKALEDKLG